MSVNLPFKATKDTFDGIYRGKIVDNNDPSKLGRVKAEIYPMLEGISADLLPWAVPATPIFEGSGNGFGYFAVPKVGTYCFFFFEGGNIYSPVCCFEAPTGVHGLPSSKDSNYPDRKIWKTSSGINIVLDDKIGELYLNHPSGTSINIDLNGNVNINASERYVNIETPWTEVTGTFKVRSAATGSFTSGDGKVITVMDGIVIGIN